MLEDDSIITGRGSDLMHASGAMILNAVKVLSGMDIAVRRRPQDGNFSADPLFCDAPHGDCTLDEASPCLDAPGCGLVGAQGRGCGTSASSLVTWGRIKTHLVK